MPVSNFIQVEFTPERTQWLIDQAAEASAITDRENEQNQAFSSYVMTEAWRHSNDDYRKAFMEQMKGHEDWPGSLNSFMPFDIVDGIQPITLLIQGHEVQVAEGPQNTGGMTDFYTLDDFLLPTKQFWTVIWEGMGDYIGRPIQEGILEPVGETMTEVGIGLKKLMGVPGWVPFAVFGGLGVAGIYLLRR